MLIWYIVRPYCLSSNRFANVTNNRSNLSLIRSLNTLFSWLFRHWLGSPKSTPLLLLKWSNIITFYSKPIRWKLHGDCIRGQCGTLWMCFVNLMMTVWLFCSPITTFMTGRLYCREKKKKDVSTYQCGSLFSSWSQNFPAISTQQNKCSTLVVWKGTMPGTFVFCPLWMASK